MTDADLSGKQSDTWLFEIPEPPVRSLAGPSPIVHQFRQSAEHPPELIQSLTLNPQSLSDRAPEHQDRTMNAPAIIFDFGNVVGYFDYGRACEAIAQPRGLYGPALLQAAREAGLNELVAQFEIGQLSAKAFAESCCALLEPSDVTPEELIAAWSDIFWPNDSLVPLIHRLHNAGHRLILGSNTNELHASRFRRQFAETLSRFDHLILSFEVGHLKPSSGFYRACVEAAATDPADCLFIDDLPENVEGARQVGLQGLCYRDTPTLVADLVRLGVDSAAPST